MKQLPALRRGSVRATALALAIPLAFAAGVLHAEFAADGARQNAAGGWTLPLPQCSFDNAYVTYTTCRTHVNAASSSADCTAQYPEYRSTGACDDGVSANATDCGNAGHTWYAKACRGNLVWNDSAAYLGTGAEANNNCTRCHNALYMDGIAHGAAADVGESYVKTGHKNMSRPLVPSGSPKDGVYYTYDDPWSGADGNPYPTIDWAGGFPFLSGGKQIYWLYNGWLATSPGLLTAGGSYSCARCHTTGWTSDSVLESAREPELTFPGITWDHTGSKGTKVDLASGVSGDPNVMASWDQWGVECSRCHGSRLEYDGPGVDTTVDYRHHVNLSPQMAAVDGSYYSKAECLAAGGAWNPQPNPSYKPYCYTDGSFSTALTYEANGATRTNLCMNCHRQETAGLPMDDDPASLKVGSSHGAIGFVGHHQGNLYLNSPHGKFDGTFAQIGDMTRYGSYFMNKDDKGGCTQCHNVHKSTVDAANPDDDGVRACTTCHAKDLNLMRHPKTAGTPFENMVSDPMSACETCHMPGDLHLFRINVDPSYTTVPLPAAFTANVSANTAPEGAYTKAVWNDLDMTCGQCHGGGIEHVDTTGNIVGGTTSLAVTTTVGFDPYQRVRIAGAGSSGADLDTYVIAVDSGSKTVTLYSPATASVTGAEVIQNPTKNGAGYISKARLAALAKGIHNDAAIAKFSATLGNPNTLLVNVNASASVCQDTCDSFTWTWGDGSTSTVNTATTSHTYGSGGPKTITLTVTDHGFQSVSTSKTINTYTPDLPPTITGDPCTWDAGTWTMTISGAASDDHGIKQEVVNWGDGTLISNDITSPFGPFVHTYAKAGIFPAKLTVVDTIGQGTSYTCMAMPTYFTMSGHIYRYDTATPPNLLPVYSAKIIVVKGTSVLKTVYSLADGSFSVGNLKPGDDYYLYVSKTGYTFPSPVGPFSAAATQDVTATSAP